MGVPIMTNEVVVKRPPGPTAAISARKVTTEAAISYTPGCMTFKADSSTNPTFAGLALNPIAHGLLINFFLNTLLLIFFLS